MTRIHISALTSILLASAVMVSQVNADDIASPANVISADSTAPTLLLSSTSAAYWDMAGGVNNYRIYDHINSNAVVLLSASSNNSNSIVVGPSGEIGLANNAVYISRSQKRMGIGTNAPEEALHVGGTGNIILEASDTSKWRIGTRPEGSIVLRDMISGNDPFEIDANAPTDSLNIASSGNIGLGTSTPSAKLDVQGNIAATFNGAGEESVYKLLTLSANDTDGDGPSEAAFVLRNEIAGQEWLFRTIDDGKAFTATLGGTGGPEFKIVSDEDDYTKTKLYIGGKLVFANGKIQSNVLP